MKFEGAINFVKCRQNHECSSEISQNWDSVIECLGKGKKYKKILDDIEKAMSPGGTIEYDSNYENYLRDNAPDETYIKFMRDCIKKIKQKYFPPVKKTITIEIEGETEDILKFTGRLNRVVGQINSGVRTNIKEVIK